MSTTSTTYTTTRPAAAGWTARIIGAALALAVTVIHVIDQGGIPGTKDPRYVGVGYWLLEVAGIVVAAGLLAPATRHLRAVWTLGLAVALGPLVGYALSRGPGLPSYSDDRGNWTEPLGVIAVLVELALLFLAVRAVRRPVVQEVPDAY